MLSRVASHLYWMARYLERAENMARILDVGRSLALVSKGAADELTAIEPLVITNTLGAFDASGRARTPEDVAGYLAWDELHGSSIFNCLRSSRENARAVRADITTEMWEDINNTWLQLLQKRHRESQPADNPFFEWVKERSHLFRGITFATIRRDQPYHFIRLGTHLERADNTARILSVKQHNAAGSRTAGTAGEPPPGAVARARSQSSGQSQGQSQSQFQGQGRQSQTQGGSAAAQSQAQEMTPAQIRSKAQLQAQSQRQGTTPFGGEITDYYRLSAVLRSVSAFEAYRDTYRDAVEPRRVAELLILDPTLPRSLKFCFDEIVRTLEVLPDATAKPARRLAATIHAGLTYVDIDEIFDDDITGYLEHFLVQIAELGDVVNEAYLELK
ncbi:MAG: alpha-E domain-containing protein [Lautropia sp.]